MASVDIKKQKINKSSKNQPSYKISPEITCKDTLGNKNSGISTLQVMHKNLTLTGSE
jgi:hypothetical protein